MKVNNELTRMFTGAAIAIALGVAAPPALAADGQPSYVDARSQNAQTQEGVGSYLSAKYGTLALVVRGEDKEILRAVYDASSQVEVKKDIDLFFIHVSDANPDDGKTEVEVHFKGNHTGTLTIDSADNMPTKLTAVVDDGIKSVDVSLYSAQKDTPSADQS
jgi:hypothetical protein